jgi:hypothetical protein
MLRLCYVGRWGEGRIWKDAPANRITDSTLDPRRADYGVSTTFPMFLRS